MGDAGAGRYRVPRFAIAFPSQESQMGSQRTLIPIAGERNPIYFVVAHRPGVIQRAATVKTNARVAVAPIVFFQIYLTASVLTFAFGPWAWPVSNPWQLYTFVFMAQAALLAGYLSALKKRPRPGSLNLPVRSAVAVSVVLNWLWLGQVYKYRTGATDLNGAVASLVAGFTNPGQQYGDRMNNYAMGAQAPAGIMNYITLLMFPILWIALPLGVVFWNQLSRWVRIALVGSIILNLLTWVAAGTNKGIADFVLLLPCLLIARSPTMLLNIKVRKLALVGLVAILGSALLFTFFSMGMLGRVGGRMAMSYDSSSGAVANSDNVLLRFVIPELQGPIAAFATYFSQGYYGLSLSLKEPFIFCYGVGHSYFLEGLSRHLVDTPILESTYPARIEASGWNLYRHWNSLYPWIASDLSFPGTIVFMFLLGRLVALVWMDVAFCRNPWAVCLLPLLLIMLFYIPANNQVLAFSDAAMPFWTLLLVWSFSRSGAKRKYLKL